MFLLYLYHRFPLQKYLSNWMRYHGSFGMYFAVSKTDQLLHEWQRKRYIFWIIYLRIIAKEVY